MNVLHIVLTAVLMLPAPARAHLEELPISTGSELLDWCRAESEAQFVAQAKTPYNWTARHFERGNTLIVEGKWRVDGVYFKVECRAARGARREYASMEMRSL